MATWFKRRVKIERIECVVPAEEPYGACWNQVAQGLEQIKTAFYQEHPGRSTLYDTDITVHVGDGEIIFRYERKPTTEAL